MSCRRDSCLRGFNACLPRLSIGTAKVESRLFSRWIPRMPVVGRSVGPPVIWRKGAGCGARGGQCSFFRGTGRRLLVLQQHRYRGGECPGAAKGGCCFLGTGRSPGRTGSGDCVVISLHLRLFGPMSGRRKGEKERERAGVPGEKEHTAPGGKRRASAARVPGTGYRVPGERAQYHRRAGECGSEVPDTSPFGLASRISYRRARAPTCVSKVHARIEIST